MAKYRFLYALIYVGSAAFALAYESKLTLVLFLGVAILPIVTLIIMVLSGMLLKVEVIPDTAYVGKMQDFDVTIKVTNRFIAPVAPIMITGTFQKADGTVLTGRHLVLNAGPLRKCEYVFGGCIRYRGEYHLGIESTVIYDFLRIFRFRLRNNPGCDVVVTPRRIMLDETNALCADDYDSSITNTSFMDSGSFASVRKYADGDLMKRVHWKLSAKHDELMVKEMEQNLGSSALIVTDMHPVSKDEDENMRAADACVEAALAITRKIISDGRSAVNVYRTNDKSVGVLSAEKPEDYERLVALFAVLPITGEKNGVETLIPRAAELLNGTEPLFIITPKLDAKVFSAIVDRVGASCGEIRIYTTDPHPSDELAAAAGSVRNASIHRLDPEDVSVSLRNSLK